VLSAGPTVPRASTDPEFLIGGSDNPFDLCHRRELQEILDRAVSRLREREQQIVRLRYQGDLTMKQIAELVHVDESRISQLHGAALGRLKASMDFLLRPRIAERAEPGARSMAAGVGA